MKIRWLHHLYKKVQETLLYLMSKNRQKKDGTRNSGSVNVVLHAGVGISGPEDPVMRRCVSAAGYLLRDDSGMQLRISYAFDIPERVMEASRRHVPAYAERVFNVKECADIGVPVAVHIIRDMIGTEKPYLMITNADDEGVGDYMPGGIMVARRSNSRAIDIINNAMGVTVLIKPVAQQFTTQHPQETVPGEQPKKKRNKKRFWYKGRNPEWLSKVEAAQRYAEASERAEKAMERRVHKSVSTDLRRRRKRKESEALAAEDKDPSDVWRVERGHVKKCMLPTSGTLNYADPCIAKKPH